MAHLFIDDGTIDSEEYASNYIHFDGSDPDCVRRMQSLARHLSESTPEKRQDIMDRVQSRKRKMWGCPKRPF